jgi:hypothetical protein
VSRERHLRRSYGLTIGQYQQMLDEQQSLCYVCRKLPVPTKKSIFIEIVAFTESRPVAFPDHADRTLLCARLFPSSRCSASRDSWHQLLVLQRSRRGHRLRLRRADRVLWVGLSRWWNDWRSALLLVKPETVIAWHRKGFRLYWNWKSRHREGRPCVSPEVRNLI